MPAAPAAGPAADTRSRGERCAPRPGVPGGLPGVCRGLCPGMLPRPARGSHPACSGGRTRDAASTFPGNPGGPSRGYRGALTPGSVARGGDPSPSPSTTADLPSFIRQASRIQREISKGMRMRS